MVIGGVYDVPGICPIVVIIDSEPGIAGGAIRAGPESGTLEFGTEDLIRWNSSLCLMEWSCMSL